MRKSKWDEIKDKLILIEGWVKSGVSEKQIASNLGISERTVNEYKKKYPQFLKVLKKGKDEIDFQVENALIKKALGYKYKETTKERVLRIDNEGNPIKDAHGSPCYEMVTTKEIIKEVAPDTSAIMFFLKNRKPEEWRDKKEMQHSGVINNEVNIKIDGEDFD